MRSPLLLLPCLLFAAACEAPLESPPPAGGYAEGERHSFNVQLGDGRLCAGDARDPRTARVVAVSARAVVFADEGNPAGGYGEADYRALAAAFDAQVWPTVTGAFGEPHDVDGNGRVLLLFTRAVNELAPEGQGWYVGGAFAARDLFPVAGSARLGACPGSNQAELVYLPVPDPAGVVNGHRRPRDAELRRAPGLMAHELQHVVNASRRLFAGGAVAAAWNEAPWLNEGLSHVAEELMAFGTSDLRPRQALTLDEVSATVERQEAFSRFVSSNFTWLAEWLRDPAATSAYGADGRATRGAAWQFLRYAADRRGGAEAGFWNRLAAPGESGLANLGRALGADPLDWMHDWLVAVYADGAVPGLADRFRQPTWDFRGLYPRLRAADGTSYGRYPLRTQALPGGTDVHLALAAGGAAYLRVGVPAGSRAEVRTAAQAVSCLSLGPVHAPRVGEVVMLGRATDVVCLAGGAAGAEYTLVPFHAGESGVLALSLRATGVVPPVAEDGAPPSAWTAAAAGGPAFGAEGWEARLRAAELRELGPLVPSGARAASAPAAATAFPLRMAVIRTR